MSTTKYGGSEKLISKSDRRGSHPKNQTENLSCAKLATTNSLPITNRVTVTIGTTVSCEASNKTEKTLKNNDHIIEQFELYLENAESK